MWQTTDVVAASDMTTDVDVSFQMHSPKVKGTKTKILEDTKFKFKNFGSSNIFMSFFLHFNLSRTPSQLIYIYIYIYRVMLQHTHPLLRRCVLATNTFLFWTKIPLLLIGFRGQQGNFGVVLSHFSIFHGLLLKHHPICAFFFN